MSTAFKVPTYWFCFAVAFGLIALIPFWRLRIGRQNVQSRIILANAYRGIWDLPWKPTLIAHTVAATAVASITTVLLHLRTERHQVARSFGLRALLLLTLACAVLAAGIRFANAHPIIVGCVLVPIVIYPITCVVALKLRPPSSSHSPQGP